MTYRGRIKNGVAVLDPPVALPEGTSVRMEVEPAGSQHWDAKSLDEFAREQGMGPTNEPAKLAIDWPAEDSIDEFLSLVREVRH